MSRTNNYILLGLLSDEQYDQNQQLHQLLDLPSDEQYDQIQQLQVYYTELLMNIMIKINKYSIIRLTF